MNAVTLDQMADMDDTARFACKLSEAELDEFIHNRDARVFHLAVRPRGGQRIEMPVIGQRSGDIAEWALEFFGADSFVSVRPA
ncbi:hypothetical protein [Roseateles depolymerans]|uniref:Uncharacterized protein n=1 Tax=Roseateles depolymerans TaxID=76731 RepID=A0A0U3L5X7_9BURK|nr:hypothetical protein [Roseateles depolymerans]ALV06670.1 hypothetical protein RD2015_2198 [Roseateles depolymerans]REG19647.1 hypothetical protein DES44_2147 [Roseateles depolymerans]